jgi:hypothetical protein
MDNPKPKPKPKTILQNHWTQDEQCIVPTKKIGKNSIYALLDRLKIPKKFVYMGYII